MRYVKCGVFIDISGAHLNNPAKHLIVGNRTKPTGKHDSACRSALRDFTMIRSLSAMTDASGRRTHYQYDGLKRLSIIKDDKDHLLEKYNYNVPQ